MNELPETLTIGVLAEAAGVNVETIRFYQRKGLMQEPDRPLGGIRRYGETDRGRVRFIKSAQRLAGCGNTQQPSPRPSGVMRYQRSTSTT